MTDAETAMEDSKCSASQLTSDHVNLIALYRYTMFFHFRSF